MADPIRSLADILRNHEWLGNVVLCGLGLLGFMHFMVWWLTQFVEWTVEIRTLWRRFSCGRSNHVRNRLKSEAPP